MLEPPGEGASRVLGLPRALVVLLGAAAVVIVAAGVHAIAWLIGPTFLALIIVIAVAPAHSWLRRIGLPAWAATIVLILLVYGVIISMALVMVVSVARLGTVLPQYTSHANQLVGSLSTTLAKLGVGPDQLKSALSSLNIGNIVGIIGTLLASVAGLATNFVFLLALLLFLSIETKGVPARLAAIAADRPRISEALDHFAWGTRRYLLVTTVFGGIVAVLDGIALAIIGIPLPVLWGLLAFITNYIPNVGFIIGVIPPALLGLLGGGWKQMVVVIVVYCVLNFVIQSLIQPRFIGDSVGLSMTITFMALFFWTWLLGPLGAILAIPLTLLAKSLLVDIDPKAGWAQALLRDSSVPASSGDPAAR
ncbi:MAG TPA: AI-2E family transporter [Pseudonocardiaceae bacterium]